MKIIKEIEVIATVSYFVSSNEELTEKEAIDFVKNRMRCGVRYEEFNKLKNNCS